MPEDIGVRRLFTAAAAVAALSAAATAETAFAAGFQLLDQSTSGEGEAFAGAAAVAEDASTIFFNPAGMSLLNGYQIVGGIQVITSNISFNPTQATTGIGGAPLTGTQGSGGVASPVPNLYVMAPLGDRWRVGLGLGAPYGLIVDYGNNWIGRYYAEKTELQTVNFNPSVAYKPADRVSLGLGFDVSTGHAVFTNAIDFGSIFAAFGTVPQTQDGQAKLKADALGYGWNAGVMVEPLDHTRIGLSYRSPVSLQFDGQANFAVPPAITGALGVLRALGSPAGSAFQNTGAHAKLVLPETVSLAINQDIDDALSLQGDLTWTHWSRFHQLAVFFDNSAQPAQITPESWHNTVRAAAGGQYKLDDMWKLRTGIAYDPTPIGTTTRTFRIPDGDRVWLSFGANVKITNRLSLDAAYTHLFIVDPHLNLVNNPANPGGNIKGSVNASADIFGIGLKYSFDDL